MSRPWRLARARTPLGKSATALPAACAASAATGMRVRGQPGERLSRTCGARTVIGMLVPPGRWFRTPESAIRSLAMIIQCLIRTLMRCCAASIHYGMRVSFRRKSRSRRSNGPAILCGDCRTAGDLRGWCQRDESPAGLSVVLGRDEGPGLSPGGRPYKGCAIQLVTCYGPFGLHRSCKLSWAWTWWPAHIS